jgi:hypothetical protein
MRRKFTIIECILKKAKLNNFKIYQVKKQLFERLRSARERNLPIHDIDLKRWSLELASDNSLTKEEFVASDTFIYNFKKKFGIISRKVTKFINRRDSANRE